MIGGGPSGGIPSYYKCITYPVDNQYIWWETHFKVIHGQILPTALMVYLVMLHPRAQEDYFSQGVYPLLAQVKSIYK